MKFTWLWLKDHLQTEKNIEEILLCLPMIGIEVDSVLDKSKKLSEFVIAKITECKQHPNADRLKILSVDDGSNSIYQVICGAPNARKGLIGVLAKPGTLIPGTGINLEIGTIRGEKSFGMMCSEKELEISDEHDGIIELVQDAKLGEKFYKFAGFDDPIITVSITPNRADCLGVRGIARDLAAAGLGKLKTLKAEKIKGSFKSPKNFKIDKIVYSKGLVPSISSRYFKNLKNNKSPKWIRQRLEAIGQRPISALVDITNYVMIDLCRPLHAYDANKIKGNNLLIRLADNKEKITTLNEKTYELCSEDLVISDLKGADDLAGIMGGERTGVSGDTKEMLLEVAIFDPVRVASTGRRLNIISDARYRFERGLDQTSPEWIHDYVSNLIINSCGGEASFIDFNGSGTKWKRSITFDPKKVFNLTGLQINEDRIHVILKDLGFLIDKKHQIWEVCPPPWRGDIDGDADLVEEVIRIYGYDKIPENSLKTDKVINKPTISKEKQNLNITKHILAGRGMIESISYTFISLKNALLFDGGNQCLQLENPISSDLNCMRPSLLPNLLSAVAQNYNREETNGSIFEVGPIFLGQNYNEQKDHISGVRFGRNAQKEWTNSTRDFDFFDVKADVEKVLSIFGHKKSSFQINRETPSWFHPGKSAAFLFGKNKFAVFGELHPKILENFKIKSYVFAFEIYVEKIPLSKSKPSFKKMLKLNPYQLVERDYSFILDKNLNVDKLVKSVLSSEKEFIKDVRVFDIYEGEKISIGKKAVGITVIMRPINQTFSDEDLDLISKKIINSVYKHCDGRLRD